MAKEIRKCLLSIEITGPTAFPGASYRIWRANPISDAYVRLVANLRPLVHKGGLGAYGMWCIRVTTGGGSWTGSRTMSLTLWSMLLISNKASLPSRRYRSHQAAAAVY